MSILRPITPKAPADFAITGATVNTTATVRPIGMSLDRATLYGASANSALVGKLYQSVDDGSTWTLVFTFSSSEGLKWLLELPDGEALIATADTTQTPGYVYRSSGWSTSHTTATWTKTLTTVGGYIEPQYTFNQWSYGSNGVVVVNEYGAQTTGSGDQTTKGRRAYLSTDFGATFTQIFDILTYGQARGVPTPTGMHLHGSAYAELDDRIYITFGDNTGDGQTIAGTGNAEIVYSDDRGATWTPLALPASETSLQVTSIAVLESAIVFASDGSAYVAVLPRLGYRRIGTMKVGAYVPDKSAGSRFTRPDSIAGAPTFYGLVTVGSTSVKNPVIMMGTDGGLTWREVWRDTTVSGSSQGVPWILGPTAGGKMVGWYMKNGQAANTVSVITASLTVPDRFPASGSVGGTATIADGGTIAHGLGVVPQRRSVTAKVKNRRVAITAVDATNLTVALEDGAGTTVSVAEAVDWTAGP